MKIIRKGKCKISVKCKDKNKCKDKCKDKCKSDIENFLEKKRPGEYGRNRYKIYLNKKQKLEKYGKCYCNTRIVVF